MPDDFLPHYKIRPAGIVDQDVIRSLIDDHEYYHHHLDWQPPLEWLGQQPFLILQEDSRNIAALACPPSPPGIGWIRLFAARDTLHHQRIWNALITKAIERASPAELEMICGLGNANWFIDLMENSHFHHHQDVVGLSVRLNEGDNSPDHSSYEIRSASESDLPQIAALDARAFDRMWQHPLPIMHQAFRQAGYFSVAQINGEIIGYQLSTTTSTSAHLARLAIEPRYQNQHIGSALIADLFQHCVRNEIHELGVNTQSDNQASLALYSKLGFMLTGERYPVYVLHLP